MKKIILAVCIMSFSVALAQRPERRTQEGESFSLEQKAQLKTKKMVLLLDLSDKQSRDILALNENWMRKKTSQKEAYKAEGGQGRKLVKVIYGKDEELHCTDMGAFQWEHGNPPTPIGLFTVTSRSIKPAEDGDFKHDLPTHLEWMEQTQKSIEWENKRHQQWLKREAARKEKPKAAEAQKERELARVLGKLLPAT